jgi:hypothetical protein
VRLLASLLLILWSAASLRVQSSTLKGTVMDESGAVVPGATVLLSGPGNATETAIAAGDGAYILTGLAPEITTSRRQHHS